MFGIPSGIQFSVSAFVLIMVVHVIEVSAYYHLSGWYYRRGPAILRERWQTRGSVDQVLGAVRAQLGADGLVGREVSGGFCFRQIAKSVNAWPRVFLGIEDTISGAAVVFAVRPFYSMGLLVFPVVWLAVNAFGVGNLAVHVTVVGVVVVFATYRWILPWDVRRIGRLRTVRRALGSIGLRVCEACGYDLFGHDVDSSCPECGWSEARSGAG